MIKNRINIMIPVRERIVLTEKAIESIWQNSTLFDKINIYVYDNKSEISKERFDFFAKLLKENKINHYSYDNDDSTYNCFGKAVLFKRWIQAMVTEHNLYEDIKHKYHDIYDNYYLLMDNDMVVTKNWDSFFISTTKSLELYEPGLRMILQSPGGVPERYRKNKPVHSLVNPFIDNNHPDKTFKVQMGAGGGGSGFWFMNYNMMKNLIWDDKHLKAVYMKHKRHDTTTWGIIRERNNNKETNYNAGIQTINPLVVHVGGYIGSLCNKLNLNQYTPEVRNQLINEELKLKDKTVDEIFDLCKEKFRGW